VIDTLELNVVLDLNITLALKETFELNVALAVNVVLPEMVPPVVGNAFESK
jgi:hypothetical protein